MPEENVLISVGKKVFDMFIKPKDALAKIEDDTLLIIVDCQYEHMLTDSRIYRKAPKVAILDHHRRSNPAITEYVFLCFFSPRHFALFKSSFKIQYTWNIEQRDLMKVELKSCRCRIRDLRIQRVLGAFSGKRP